MTINLTSQIELIKFNHQICKSKGMQPKNIISKFLPNIVIIAQSFPLNHAEEREVFGDKDRLEQVFCGHTYSWFEKTCGQRN